MTSRSRRTLIVILTLALAVFIARPNASQKGPALPDVLQMAGDYLVQYAKQLGTVSAEEEFVQRDLTNGLGSAHKMIDDFVFVGLSNGVVAAFRDVYSVDSQARRDRQDRLTPLFQDSAAAGLQKAQQYTEDAVHEYVSPTLHTLDDPTLALQFIRKENQDRSTFKLDSVKTMNGAQVAILKYNEKGAQRLIMAPENPPASGRFWIDVATGAIRQTELVLSTGTYNLRCTVTFTLDPTLKLWMPSETYEQLDVSGGTGTASVGSGYGSHQTLEGREKYTKFHFA